MKNSFNTIYASRGLNLSRFKLVGNLSLLVGKSRISTSFSYPGFVVQVGILVLFWFQTKSLCRKTLELVASLGFPWFEGSTSPNTSWIDVSSKLRATTLADIVVLQSPEMFVAKPSPR